MLQLVDPVGFFHESFSLLLQSYLLGYDLAKIFVGLTLGFVGNFLFNTLFNIVHRYLEILLLL